MDSRLRGNDSERLLLSIFIYIFALNLMNIGLIRLFRILSMFWSLLSVRKLILGSNEDDIWPAESIA